MQGRKLHTGRSRNDQVALDMKLYTRDEIEALDTLVKGTCWKCFLKLMKEHIGDVYAGIYTSSESTADHTCASSWRIF